MSGRRALRLLRRLGFTAGLLAAVLPELAAKGAKAEFGPYVLIFDPSMPSQVIQKQIDAVYATQEHNEFGPQRNALLFMPGSYSVDVPLGFYTEVMGLLQTGIFTIVDSHRVGNIEETLPSRLCR